MYWFPEEIFTDAKLLNAFLSDIPVEYGIRGYETTIAGTDRKQIVIEKPAGYDSLNYVQGDYILKNQLAAMDKAGIDKAILKIPGCHEWMSLSMCRFFNDGMAEYVKQSNGKLAALAVVPPGNYPECFDELERCKNKFGMTGVQLCAHYGDRYFDDEIFVPFFEKLNEFESTVYIHHTPVPVDFNSICAYTNLRRTYGRCVDQAVALGRELFSGFFSKFPKLKFVHSMLGGGFFAFYNMLIPKKTPTNGTIDRFQYGNDSILDYLQNNVFFEMSHAQPWGKYQLECAINVLGADHVIFGTSYPVQQEWQSEGVTFINRLNITDKDKDMILNGNARSLYHLE
jgi:predicted TIM-barrel fold metal-dependent hydrolase